MTKEFYESVMSAIAECKAHWRRMAAWVYTKCGTNDVPNRSVMFEALNENWFSESCALCRIFTEQGCVSCHTCDGDICPMTPGCNSYDSVWNRVHIAKTWGEWYTGAELMQVELDYLAAKLKYTYEKQQNYISGGRTKC